MSQGPVLHAESDPSGRAGSMEGVELKGEDIER